MAQTQKTVARRAPDVIPLQPEPADISVVRCDVPGVQHMTGLYRIWLDGDGDRCRRCRPESCNLKAVPGRPDVASCIVVVAGRALPRLAADRSIRG